VSAKARQTSDAALISLSLAPPVVGDEPQAARRAVGDRMHRAASHSPRRMRGEHADFDFLGNFPNTIDVARHRHLG
jgi:hypothetical protein